MSQIPSGGAVIPVTADLTAAYAEVVAFRKEAAKPISIGASGGGGSPQAQARAAFAPGLTSAVPGISPMTFAAAAAAGVGATPFAPTGGFGNAFPTNALQQAATALQQAAQALTQSAAVQQAAGRGGGAGQASGGSGPSRFGGIRTSGLARYVAAGFLAHEALNIFGGFRQAGIESSLAAGNPLGELRAGLAYHDRLASIPLFGQAADLLTDPDGQGRLGIERTVLQSGLQDRYADERFGLRNQTIGVEARAGLAGLSGPRRTLAELEAVRDAKLRDINTVRSGPEASARFQQLEQQAAQEKKVIIDEYNASAQAIGTTGRGSPNVLGLQAATAIRDSKLSAADTNDITRRTAFDAEFSRQRDAVQKEYQADRGRLLFGFNIEAEQARAQTEGINFRLSGAGRAAILVENAAAAEIFRRTADKNFDLTSKEGRDAKNAAEALLGTQNRARLVGFDRETSQIRFGLNTDTETSNIMSGLDPRSQSLDPSSRPLMAELNQIVRQAQAGERSAINSGREDLVPDFAIRGRAAIVALRSRMTNSLRPEIVAPGELLPGGAYGGFDYGRFNSAINQAADDVWKPAPDGSNNKSGNDEQATAQKEATQYLAKIWEKLSKLVPDNA